MTEVHRGYERRRTAAARSDGTRSSHPTAGRVASRGQHGGGGRAAERAVADHATRLDMGHDGSRSARPARAADQRSRCPILCGRSDPQGRHRRRLRGDPARRPNYGTRPGRRCTNRTDPDGLAMAGAAALLEQRLQASFRVQHVNPDWLAVEPHMAVWLLSTHALTLDAAAQTPPGTPTLLVQLATVINDVAPRSRARAIRGFAEERSPRRGVRLPGKTSATLSSWAAARTRWAATRRAPSNASASRTGWTAVGRVPCRDVVTIVGSWTTHTPSDSSSAPTLSGRTRSATCAGSAPASPDDSVAY